MKTTLTTAQVLHPSAPAPTPVIVRCPRPGCRRRPVAPRRDRAGAGHGLLRRDAVCPAPPAPPTSGTTPRVCLLEPHRSDLSDQRASRPRTPSPGSAASCVSTQHVSTGSLRAPSRTSPRPSRPRPEEVTPDDHHCHEPRAHDDRGPRRVRAALLDHLARPVVRRAARGRRAGQGACARAARSGRRAWPAPSSGASRGASGAASSSSWASSSPASGPADGPARTPSPPDRRTPTRTPSSDSH